MYQKKVDMEARGWVFGPPRSCSCCGEAISWAKNPETERTCSFDLNTTTCHLKSCSGAQSAAPASPPPSTTRPAASATAPALAANDLQTTMVALTQSVRELTAELKSRRPASPAPASARRGFDEGECPTDR